MQFLRRLTSKLWRNSTSVSLHFSAAKCRYSSTTEDKHQFWSFLKQPTTQPVRCWRTNKKSKPRKAKQSDCTHKEGNYYCTMNKSRFIQFCRWFPKTVCLQLIESIKRIFLACQGIESIDYCHSLQQSWYTNANNIKVIPFRVCSGWELDGSSHLKI